MTRKEDFFNLYNKYKDDTNFMVIGIEMPDLESHEFIVNHKSNFEEKMKYYDSAYDENLIMIRNRDIKIVSFMFAEEVVFAEYEPFKEGDVWRSYGKFDSFPLKNIFEHVKWTDEEALKFRE